MLLKPYFERLRKVEVSMLNYLTSLGRPQLITLLRLTPILFSFMFSLYYSRLMGIQARSTFTFILILNTLLSFLLLSGLGIRIRTSSSVQESKELVPAYLLVSFFISFMISTALLGILTLITPFLQNANNYSLPRNALIAIFLYSFLASLSIVFFDLLSTLQSLKAFLLIETFVILSQIVLFFVLVTIGETSVLVSTLLAFSVSYSFLIFSTIVVIISNSHFSLDLRTSLKLFFKLPLFDWFLRGFANNLMERSDKLAIPFFYATPQLAQVTIFSSILQTLRIVPDTFIRNSQNSVLNGGNLVGKTMMFKKWQVIALLIIVSLLANLIIYFALGPEWLLTLPIIVLITTYELFVWMAKSSLTGSTDNTKKISFFSTALLVFFYLFLVPFLMMTFSYEIFLLFLIVFLIIWQKFTWPKLRKVPS